MSQNPILRRLHCSPHNLTSHWVYQLLDRWWGPWRNRRNRAIINVSKTMRGKNGEEEEESTDQKYQKSPLRVLCQRAGWSCTKSRCFFQKRELKLPEKGLNLKSSNYQNKVLNPLLLARYVSCLCAVCITCLTLTIILLSSTIRWAGCSVLYVE